MKIAFLTPEYSHAKTGISGGIGTSIHNLAVGLVQQGHSVRVLVYGQIEESIFEDNGIVIQQIKNVKFKGLSWWFTRKKLERIIDTLYEDKKIDLVEAPDWTGITSFIHPKICPVVIRLNGSDTYFCHLDNRAVKWNNKFHEQKALQNADGLVSVSHYTATISKALFNLKSKIVIIPNSINLPSFTSNYENGIIDNTILYFGTLIRKKGSLELPLIFNEIYKINKNAKLVVIGKDSSDIVSGNVSTWNMMQPLFDKEALQNVTYFGSVSYDKIKYHINSAAVCVFPSFAEALPVSWIEAMAMQKAIVASNIGWATEVIDDGVNGYLVSPKEHFDFAQKVLTLLEDKNLRAQFGIEARKKVEQNFSIEVVAKQSVDFYKKMINEKSNKKSN